jgi:prepilin-type processing-associated H-X9-DG protein
MSAFTRKSLLWESLSWLELLMVLLVFALLGAILFPVYTNGGPTRRHPCISRVKQLALATIIYISDYDDRFPPRDSWMDGIFPYHKNESIERCPTFAFDEKAPKNLYGYAMNQAMSGAKPPPNIATVPLIFDSVNLARSASGTLDSLPNPGRHKGMNVIGFADGHVKRFDPNKP